MLDLPPISPAIEISIASRGMSKGVAQTEGPQLVVKPSVAMGPFQAGAQWKNVTSSVAGGEGAIFIGLSHEVAKFELSLHASHKFQTGVKGPTDDHSWEFSGGVRRKLGKVTLHTSIVYSPDDLGGARQSIYLEGGPALAIDKHFKLSANLGHRERKNGDDYTSFNAGLSTTIVPMTTLDVRWYDTNRSDLGENFQSRIVASARLAF